MSYMSNEVRKCPVLHTSDSKIEEALGRSKTAAATPPQSWAFIGPRERRGGKKKRRISAQLQRCQ